MKRPYLGVKGSPDPEIQSQRQTPDFRSLFQLVKVVRVCAKLLFTYVISSESSLKPFMVYTLPAPVDR